jgi:hypothetical protein
LWVVVWWLVYGIIFWFFDWFLMDFLRFGFLLSAKNHRIEKKEKLLITRSFFVFFGLKK